MEIGQTDVVFAESYAMKHFHPKLSRIRWESFLGIKMSEKNLSDRKCQDYLYMKCEYWSTM